MQRLIACSEDGFAFGNPDRTVLKNYAYLTMDDCVRMDQLLAKIDDPDYGHRYRLLNDGITAVASDLEEVIGDLKYVALVVLPHGPLFVDVRCYDGGELGHGGIQLQFYMPYTIDQRPCFWPAIGHAIEIPTDLSVSGLALARSWLQDCTSLVGRHKDCSRSDDTSLMPTRVIDVGSDSTQPRLHLSRPEEKGHWVALSHCWGNVTPIKTTTLTVNTFVEGLPKELPKTFADAIFVTRALGQRYLWIDSLCIVQDSAEDWATEASRMDQVYSRALFTIVADAADNSTSGFLQPPSRQVKESKVIHYDLGANSAESEADCTGVVHVRARGELAYQLPYHGFHPDVNWTRPPEQVIRSKLSTRAWAFQERLLSPRTLHFGPNEMAWECRALCTCECSATNERTGLTTSLLKGSHALQPSHVGGELEKKGLGIIDNAWQRDIVEEYTRLHLTMDTDRLSALAGLATTTLALRPGDQYMAGLWRSTLASGLSWYTAIERASTRLPSGEASGMWSHMPTWSWAAVSGQIRHARVANVPVGSPLIKILDIEYKASAKYPMGSGPQTPASLTVWGYVVPIESLWFQHYSSSELPASHDGYDWKESTRPCYRVQWPPGVSLPNNCVAMMDVHKDIPPFDDQFRWNRLDEVEPEPDSLMLLTACTQGQVFGVILRRHTTSGDVPAYERSGFVNGSTIMKDLHRWSSVDYSHWPIDEPEWPDYDDEGQSISSLLGGIGESMIKIF